MTRGVGRVVVVWFGWSEGNVVEFYFVDIFIS